MNTTTLAQAMNLPAKLLLICLLVMFGACSTSSSPDVLTSAIEPASPAVSGQPIPQPSPEQLTRYMCSDCNC
ncbi:MAG: hypothetical protein AAF412_14230, partial [Pseudomonadota bacterium]